MKKLIAPLVALVALFGLGGSAVAATAVNRTTTPGATDAAATQQTVCASAHTPRSGLSSSMKRRIFAAYHIKKKQQPKYVINRLVPISLGGTNDATNLWPELKSEAKRKAAQEGAVHTFVCAHLVDLAVAQQAFQSNWKTADY